MNGDEQLNGGLLVYTGGANMNGIAAGNISYTIQSVTVSSSGIEWYATFAYQYNSLEQILSEKHQNNVNGVTYNYIAIG